MNEILKCDLCKNEIGVRHLSTIPIADQELIFKNIHNIHHVHICSDCILKRFSTEALNEVEKQIVDEVLKKSLKG